MRMTTKDDIERLFRTHYVAMYRLAMLMLRDDNAARDIVHDVFETLLVSGQSDVAGAYLMAAVRNRCLKHIRSLSAQARLKAAYSIDEQTLTQRLGCGRPSDEEDWPDEATIALIQSSVSNDLSDACRRVVNLRFTEGKSYQEIADALGISKAAVYKNIRRAIDVLREKLSRNG